MNIFLRNTSGQFSAPLIKNTPIKASLPKINISAQALQDKAPVSNTPQSIKSRNSDVDKVFDQLFDKQSGADKSMLKFLQNPDSEYFANFVSSFSGGMPLQDHDPQKMVYTIAAKYVALEQSIKDGDFSDAEKEQMQARLDRQLESGLNELSQRYGQATKELFDNLGQPSMSVAASSSLTELIQGQIKTFKDLVESDEGKALLNDAKNQAASAGMKLHDGDITKLLVEQEAKKRVENEKKEQELNLTKLTDSKQAQKAAEVNADAKGKPLSGFTLNDLQALGDVADALSAFVDLDPSKSEEQIGYEFGLGLIKAKESMQSHKASEFLDKLVTDGYKDFMDSNIMQRNKSLRSKQKQNEEFSESNQNPQAYTTLDSSKIHSAFDKTMSSYSATGDAKEAVIAGFEAAKLSFKNNMALNERSVRYQNSKFFFQNFYTSNNKHQNSSYTTGMSDYKRFMMRMEQ